MANWIKFIVCSSLMLFGCMTSFNSYFSELRIGASKQNVISNLGNPDIKKEESMVDEVIWGPQQVLIPIIKPGDQYVEWQYERNSTIYYIWFSGDRADSKDTWKLIAKSFHPKGAVFEPGK